MRPAFLHAAGEQYRTTLDPADGNTVLGNTPDAWSQRAALFDDPGFACGWAGNSQTERLQRCVEALDITPGDSLLDFGCGTGELVDHLPPRVVYTGVDWADGMVERARRDHPGWRFITTLEGTYDWAVFAGTFNLGDAWAKPRTWDTIETVWVQRVWRGCVVALNSNPHPYLGDLSYSLSEVKAFAVRMNVDWTVERWHHDLLLTLRRP